MKKIALLFISMMLSTILFAQFPTKTNRLVNDYAGLFTDRQCMNLEHRLVAFADTTSNQILIITTPHSMRRARHSAARPLPKRS